MQEHDWFQVTWCLRLHFQRTPFPKSNVSSWRRDDFDDPPIRDGAVSVENGMRTEGSLLFSENWIFTIAPVRSHSPPLISARFDRQTHMPFSSFSNTSIFPAYGIFQHVSINMTVERRRWVIQNFWPGTSRKRNASNLFSSSTISISGEAAELLQLSQGQ